MHKTELETIYYSVLNKSKELFNPSESVFLDTQKKVFTNSLPHIESILKAYDNAELMTEFNKWIDQNNYNISYYEKLRSNSNFPKQWINDRVFFCHVYKSIYSELKKSLKPAEKKKAVKISYVWQNNPDKELPELYRLMTEKYKLIEPETTYEQFEAVFTRQPIESINPIRWKESNRLLAYFLDRVFNGQDWQSIAGNGSLFKNKKGKTITANDLSVAKKNYIDYGEPKGYEMIDKILSSIKKHSEH